MADSTNGSTSTLEPPRPRPVSNIIMSGLGLKPLYGGATNDVVINVEKFQERLGNERVAEVYDYLRKQYPDRVTNDIAGKRFIIHERPIKKVDLLKDGKSLLLVTSEHPPEKINLSEVRKHLRQALGEHPGHVSPPAPPAPRQKAKPPETRKMEIPVPGEPIPDEFRHGRVKENGQHAGSKKSAAPENPPPERIVSQPAGNNGHAPANPPRAPSAESHHSSPPAEARAPHTPAPPAGEPPKLPPVAKNIESASEEAAKAARGGGKKWLIIGGAALAAVLALLALGKRTKKEEEKPSVPEAAPVNDGLAETSLPAGQKSWVEAVNPTAAAQPSAGLER